MLETNEMLWKRAEKAILTHKLYLRADMSRRLLDRYVHIPKNKFAPLFREFTGVGFPLMSTPFVWTMLPSYCWTIRTIQ